MYKRQLELQRSFVVQELIRVGLAIRDLESVRQGDLAGTNEELNKQRAIYERLLVLQAEIAEEQKKEKEDKGNTATKDIESQRVLDDLVARANRKAHCVFQKPRERREREGAGRGSRTTAGSARARSTRTCLLYTSPSPRD